MLEAGVGWRGWGGWFDGGGCVTGFTRRVGWCIIWGMKSRNPFVISGYRGSEYFCDRVAESAKLRKLVCNGSNVTLLAPRRYGKTGLICNVFEKLAAEDGFQTIYIDVFGTQNLAEFTRTLAQAVIGKLDTPLEKLGGAARRLIQGLRPTVSYDEASGKPTLSVSIAESAAERTLEETFAYLKEHERRLVIAIDEFQQIREYPEKNVEAVLRSHMQFVPCQFIFSGSRQHIMRDMFISPKRPFYQSTTMMPLDVIAEEPYYDFANGFFEAAGRKLSREAFHGLYERFDGITWYLQAILWQLYAEGGDVSSAAQVDAAVEERIAANQYEEQQILSLLPAGARRLVRAIAAEGLVAEPQSGEFVAKHGLRAASSVRTSLEMLLEKEIVYASAEGYVVYDRFFGEYLKR